MGTRTTVVPPTTTSLLLILFLFTLSLSSILDGAHAGNIPPTITSGTYTSTDDTVLASGTTLNVPAMLTNAVSNSQTEAVCTLLRTTFTGTLTITLPTTAGAWTTTNNIPLRILIQDGISGTPPPAAFMSISGVLALGSSITIEGGDYDYSNKRCVTTKHPILYSVDGNSIERKV
jgi:hypothetical protein